MSHGYRAIQWNPFKRRFDAWMLAGMLLFVLGFGLGSTLWLPPGLSFTPLQVLIRATGLLGRLMLSFALCIGPPTPLLPGSPTRKAKSPDAS